MGVRGCSELGAVYLDCGETFDISSGFTTSDLFRRKLSKSLHSDISLRATLLLAADNRKNARERSKALRSPK